VAEPPGKIICIGLNYADHAAEAGLPIPDEPICFAKWPTALIGDGEPIRLPSITSEIDYEAELAVVIGRTATDVAEADALDHVAGFACFNDVSARDLQRRDGQWSRSKSFDTFAPMGPVVPIDSVGDPQTLAIRCEINGEVLQSGTTADMIFPVARLIAFLSQSATLRPGDVIATGTPAGIGLAKRPPRFLRPGDVVSVEIERIGRLTNPVAGDAVRS
jgi:2-keto-4-pentenoate hydratase/2-oxohepta-3-ene-1,7-dioic acid hydratase in catechol pathway